MNSIEANARRVVPAERARALLDLRSTLLPMARLIEVGNIQRHMTAAEINAVRLYWNSLSGNASFASTLARLACAPDEPEPPHSA